MSVGKDITGPLSLKNVNFQFCSDWLKEEIRRVLKERDAFRDENLRLEQQIVANHLEDEKIFDAWNKKIQYARAEAVMYRKALENAHDFALTVHRRESPVEAVALVELTNQALSRPSMLYEEWLALNKIADLAETWYDSLEKTGSADSDLMENAVVELRQIRKKMPFKYD